jgi:hypothetical protein
MDSKCVICLNKNNKNSKCCEFGCKHYFHNTCLFKTGCEKCPLCRINMNYEEKEQIIIKKYKMKLNINELKENNPILNSINNKNLLHLFIFK